MTHLETEWSFLQAGVKWEGEGKMLVLWEGMEELGRWEAEEKEECFFFSLIFSS